MDSKIWLSSPHMGGDEERFVKEAFDSNWVAPLGPNVTGFENDLESYLGVENNVAALSSGTAALHLALVQLNVSMGDEVICQSMTFSASANPIVYLGATPVFVDSEETTWNMCPNALREALENRLSKGVKPKAIIVVHLYGMPCQIEEIMKIASEFGVPVVEDSAESLGSFYKNKACGTFGDYGVLSFNGNKIITTSGGGALICKNETDKEKTIFLATQARDVAPHYQHSEIGYNYRLSNICAGIGRGQMLVLDKHITLRRKMNDFYVDLFSDIDGVRVLKEPSPSFFSNHWLSCILIDKSKTNGISSEHVRLALEAANIESRPLWKPMHLQPVFKNSPYYGKNVAQHLFENGLCLPSGSNLTDHDRERIRAVIVEIFKQS